eukprot:8155080-Pyramimonas_sp.AAC.1
MSKHYSCSSAVRCIRGVDFSRMSRSKAPDWDTPGAPGAPGALGPCGRGGARLSHAPGGAAGSDFLTPDTVGDTSGTNSASSVDNNYIWNL